jgi:hypothetical protein
MKRGCYFTNQTRLVTNLSNRYRVPAIPERGRVQLAICVSHVIKGIYRTDIFSLIRSICNVASVQSALII